MQVEAEMCSLILLSVYLEFCSQNSHSETHEKVEGVARLGKAKACSMIFQALSIIIPCIYVFVCDQDSHQVVKKKYSSNKTFVASTLTQRRLRKGVFSWAVSCAGIIVFLSFQTTAAPGANAGPVQSHQRPSSPKGQLQGWWRVHLSERLRVG